MNKKNIFKLIILCLMLVCLTSCGEEDVVEHIHEWSEWEINNEATCAKEGLKSRYCLGCEAKDEVVLNCIAHSFDEGKIISQKAFEYYGNDIEELETMIHKVEHELYPRTINELLKEL